MSVPIVVDEWLFHDLMGQNGSEKQYQTLAFLSKLLEICDRIVVLANSPFQVKAGELMSSSNPVVRGMSQFFNTSILLNSEKTELIDVNDLPPLTGHLRGIPQGDQYLFQAYLKLKTKGSFILTTDSRWKPSIIKKASIVIKMRDEFLKEYLTRTRTSPNSISNNA